MKLLGSYREFVERDVPGSPAPVPEANGAGPRIRHQDDGYIRQALPPMLASHIKCPCSTLSLPFTWMPNVRFCVVILWSTFS